MPFLLPLITATGGFLASLGAWISGIIYVFVGFLVARVGWRLGVELAVIALVTGLTVTVIGTIKAAIFAISFTLPPEFVHGYNLLVPSNFVPCLSAIFSAKVVRWAWEWSVHMIYLLKSSLNG